MIWERPPGTEPSSEKPIPSRDVGADDEDHVLGRTHDLGRLLRGPPRRVGRVEDHLGALHHEDAGNLGHVDLAARNHRQPAERSIRDREYLAAL